MNQTNDTAGQSAETSDPGDAARAALAEILGTTEFQIIAEVPRRMPSGEEVRLLHAAVRGQPNRTASVVVDSTGTVHPQRRLEALAGPELFAPEIHAPEQPVSLSIEPVVISPTSNDLVLPECRTDCETITVRIPRVGTAAKADVYMLADTTGSMGSIISAVQAGITTVVNDPAFATFDVAWGAGEYKDFPIPLNPFAFQHELVPTPGAAAVAATVATWSASGGGDTPEGQLFALHQVATDQAIGWRPDSKRIVVWFGDAPGHDPLCTAVSGVADITEASVTADLVAAGITVVAISTDTGLTADEPSRVSCTLGYV
jgi:hypothetical protein